MGEAAALTDQFVSIAFQAKALTKFTKATSVSSNYVKFVPLLCIGMFHSCPRFTTSALRFSFEAVMSDPNPIYPRMTTISI